MVSFGSFGTWGRSLVPGEINLKWTSALYPTSQESQQEFGGGNAIPEPAQAWPAINMTTATAMADTTGRMRFSRLIETSFWD